jgi:hypothetical protein
MPHVERMLIVGGKYMLGAVQLGLQAILFLNLNSAVLHHGHAPGSPICLAINGFLEGLNLWALVGPAHLFGTYEAKG